MAESQRCDQCNAHIPRLEAPAIRLEGWKKAIPRRIDIWVCSPSCKRARQVRAVLGSPRIFGLEDWVTIGPEWSARYDRVKKEGGWL